MKSISQIVVIIILKCCKIRIILRDERRLKMKKINGNKTVFILIQENPELKDVLVNLGFTPLNDPKMLNTVGRMMSLNNGAKQIKITPETLQAGLNKAGFELEA